MRVAICSAGELYGGVERFICLLARHLRTSNHIDVIVVLFHRGLLYNILRKIGIETYVVDSASKYDPRMVRSIVRIFSRRHIDVVHTHGYKATVICGLAAQSLGAATVKTEHGVVELPLRPQICALKSYVNRAAEQLITLAFVNSIVYVTQDLAARFRLIHSCKMRTIIHNGIAPIASVHRGEIDGLNRRHFNVGVVGRIDRVKGHVVVLRALDRLSDLTNLRVHIFGRGPLQGKLKQYCAFHNLNSKVIFWGFRENIHDYVHKLDTLLMPSLHEGLPYALLEAMYLRVPIVASAVGGLREILRNNENALLIPPDDDEKLATAIRRLYEDASERERISQQAFVDVTSKFMIEGTAERYIDVYRATMAQASMRSLSMKRKLRNVRA